VFRTASSVLLILKPGVWRVYRPSKISNLELPVHPQQQIL
jgi:hypothetical protein